MFTSFRNIKIIKKTKQAFSLIEVLIAVMLLSVVIVALLQTNQNNLSLLNKFESSSAKNNYINLAFFGINTSLECKDENFHLDDIADFKDDEIRKQLKEVKITSKCEKLKEQKIEAENHQFLILATKQNLKIENTSENVIGNTQDKDFYRFSLEYK